MKEINISAILVKKRKEKLITQDELASYLGVSKAAVSKWETGQSYPDITLLPLLAAYFNISIDSLMGYRPQMVKEDIKSLYLQFCDEFVNLPFDEVKQHWDRVVRKYYACAPLLMQMSVVLLNHSGLLGSPEKMNEIFIECRALFHHVREIAEDVYLIGECAYLEAYCSILLNEPEEAMVLLEDCTRPELSSVGLLASAYERMGKKEQAIETLQVALYQKVLGTLGLHAQVIKLYEDQPGKSDMWIKSFFQIAGAMGIEEMHPGAICSPYIEFADVYAAQGRVESALGMLERYMHLVTGDIYPIKLRGNDFFDKIDHWLQELELGTNAPRSEEVIKASMAEGPNQMPSLALLKEEPRYQNIVRQLKSKLLGNQGGNENE